MAAEPTVASHRLEITHHASGSGARAGVLHTAAGTVETPLLCIVGVGGGSVGGATPAELRAHGVGVLLARTYELLSWPGPDVVQRLGGVHALTGWDGPIITDSGAAEVFGLGAERSGRADWPSDEPPLPTRPTRRARGQPARLLRVDDDGAHYTSPHDGSYQRLTPESAMAAQVALGGDIMTALDRPAAAPAAAADAMHQTHAWARRCLAARAGLAGAAGRALYGVVQGGPGEAIQRASAAAIGSLPFDGAVVSPGGDVGGTLAAVLPHLPRRWPRQARGELTDLVRWVDGGIDLVECAAPARLGQRGLVYTGAGTQSVRDLGWRDDTAAIDDRCACYTCRAPFSRGYLHHLFACDELLGYTLATLHNVHTAVQLMRDLRAAIVADRLASFRDAHRTGRL